jgi:glutamate dehydrogenase/leucine dehydrogenase
MHPAVGIAIESPQKVVEWNFLAAAGRLRLEPELVQRLRMPSRELAVSVPVRRQSGGVLLVECVRVLHSNLRGPALGGMQMHLPTDEFVVGPMAFSNTLGSTVTGVPFGGSFGAFCCDLNDLSADEREQLALGYAARVEPIFGPYRDVYAKSECTPVLKLMLNGATVDASFGEVCGKPPERGGLLDEKLAENALPALILQLANAFLHVREPLKVAVAGEPPRAKAIAQTLRWTKMNAIAAGQKRTHEELLASPCDVLVYCGESCSFTPAAVEAIRARMVVEASPMAITPAADTALQGRRIEVVPDLLARAPEFIAAHLEWSQNLEGTQYSESRLRKTMQERIEKACSRVLERAEERELTLREAAYEIAVEGLARCEGLRAVA